VAQRTLLVERETNTLRQLTRLPRFTDYLHKTYLPLLATSGKKPATLVTENTHYKRWDQALGHLRLDKIRASHVAGALSKLQEIRSARTTNIALVCLRHDLHARRFDVVKHLGSDGGGVLHEFLGIFGTDVADGAGNGGA